MKKRQVRKVFAAFIAAAAALTLTATAACAGGNTTSDDDSHIQTPDDDNDNTGGSDNDNPGDNTGGGSGGNTPEQSEIFWNKVAAYSTGFSDAEGGVAEIVQYNSDNGKLYLVNGKTQTIDIVTL